jgi:hypothetical protein
MAEKIAGKSWGCLMKPSVTNDATEGDAKSDGADERMRTPERSLARLSRQGRAPSQHAVEAQRGQQAQVRVLDQLSELHARMTRQVALR